MVSVNGDIAGSDVTTVSTGRPAAPFLLLARSGTRGLVTNLIGEVGDRFSGKGV
jgi:hypothetical protein